MAKKSSVVVGVDGSASALAAVRLATREAARRGWDLRIVHALSWPQIDVSVRATMATREDVVRHDAERLLAEAAATAAATDGSVTISTKLVTGASDAVLLAEAYEAGLVVIGDRGMGGFVGLLLGSVAVQLTARTATPVLVARGEEHPAGAVVVGADDSPSSASAVEEAFVEAELRDAQLHAVRVAPPAITSPITPADHDKALAEEREALARILADARARHPDVHVQEDVVLGQPGRILIQLSEMAQLVAVGARGRGGFTGLLLGSVSQQVVHHAGCPVLVVSRGGRDTTS